MNDKPSWQKVALCKRKSVFQAIPEEWRLEPIPSVDEAPNAVEFVDKQVSTIEKKITDLSLLQLQAKIGAGELSALQVTKAFAHRAAILDQLTNCCSEIFFERAFQQAKKQDEWFAKCRKTMGPLHGIPISLKDQFNLEGLDSAMGFVSLVNQPIEKQDVSKLAIILEQMGAIFFIKTTTPPAMMSFATISSIYGETVNAFNRRVSSGGSSGGEGVIIAARGAVVGWGTDIGGSIRVPSAFGGIYGLKPLTCRLPYCHLTNSFAHQPVLSSVVGPMASSLQDLKYITKLVIDAQPWLLDPKVPPIEWRQYKFTEIQKKKQLTFAVMKWNKVVHPAPPVVRAIDKAVQLLKSQGHEIIEWSPPMSSIELANIAVAVYGADGYQEVVDYTQASGEPIIPEILAIAAAPDNGKANEKEITLPTGCSTVLEHWEQARQRYAAQQAVDSYWFEHSKKLTKDGSPIDGLLAPVWDVPSFKTKDVVKFYGDYTAQFNTLDYSIVVVPVLRTDPEIDRKPEHFEPVGGQDEQIHGLYDEKLLENVPVGVQVVAPRWQEETAIALAEVVDNALKCGN